MSGPACVRAGFGGKFACMVCHAGPGQACGGPQQQVDPFLPVDLPTSARLDFTGGGVPRQYPGMDGAPLTPAAGLCWDCRCPMEVPVHREGTDQLVCRDCADLHVSPWGCKNGTGQAGLTSN